MRTERFASPADCAACRGSIRQGSKSFHLASLFLPVAIREPAYAVYAFCRMADDMIDREQGGGRAIAELGRLLDRIYAGRPGADFVERALADVAAEFSLPRALPEALIEGLAWDASGRRYETLDELAAYAVRVAGTVGAMMTVVMSRRDPSVLARACDLGVAMQYTNICRDIGEDAAEGRLYLPGALLRAEGVDPEDFLLRPAYQPGVRAVVARLLAEAERLYDRSAPGIAALPPRARSGIGAARLLYREIGRQVASGVDPVARRSVTTRRRKLSLLAKAALSPSADLGGLRAAALPQAQFLIDAVMAAPEPPHQPPLPHWLDVGGRATRMVELLAAFGAPEPASAKRDRTASA